MEPQQKLSTLIDSHCHLQNIDLTEFKQNSDQLLKEAQENGVGRFLSVCIELEDVPKLEALADQYSQVWISVGVHPNVETLNEPDANELIALAKHPSCIAIGETGLDYYRTVTTEGQQTQRQRFEQHIYAARKISKPLIIHTRMAAEDTLSDLKQFDAFEVGGVMHCFGESWEVARRAMDLNFYISFSGIVTFKNAQDLQDVAKKVPLDRILIETDSPYLAPTPFRGKQNHPALVKYVAEKISELKGLDYETVARHTTANFYQCFRIKNR